MSKLNRKLIFHILGLLLMFNGFAMLISAFVSYLTNDGVLNEMTIVSLLVIFFGWLFSRILKPYIQYVSVKCCLGTKWCSSFNNDEACKS